MSKSKLGKLFYEYGVLLTGIPLIIGIHWGWWKMQQNPNLVDPKTRRELPIYSMYKKLHAKVFGDSSNLSSNDAIASTTFKEELED